MKKSNGVLPCFIICAGLLCPAIARADSLLELQLKKDRAAPPISQTIAIKGGQIMVKAIGGDSGLDLLYSRAAESVVIVDHRQRKLMTVDEQQVARISQQAKEVQPLLQEFSQQIAKLAPEERQKWQELLGGSVSLDQIAEAAAPPEPSRLVSAGEGKVAGIRCRKMWVMQGATPISEVCLAEAAALQLPADDSATLQALFGLYEKLAARGQKVARQFGLSLPTLGSLEPKGIPVKMLDLSRDESMSVTLRQVKTAAVAPELMKVPSAYKTEPLSLWP